MDFLIEQTNEILLQLEETNQLITDNIINNITIEKIKIIHDDLLTISEKLTKLNIKLKQNEKIELTDIEIDYLKCEKESNELISKVMPALIILSLGKN